MDEETGEYKKKYLKVVDTKSDEFKDQLPRRRRRRRGNEEENEQIQELNYGDFIDKNKTYRLGFVEKAREGSDNQKILLFELDGDHGDMHEVCWVDNVYTGQLSY